MNYSFTFDCGKAREKCVSKLNGTREKKISKIFGPGMIFFLLHNGKCVTNARDGKSFSWAIELMEIG